LQLCHLRVVQHFCVDIPRTQTQRGGAIFVHCTLRQHSTVEILQFLVCDVAGPQVVQNFDESRVALAVYLLQLDHLKLCGLPCVRLKAEPSIEK
jgi:hypothetical protein